MGKREAAGSRKLRSRWAVLGTGAVIASVAGTVAGLAGCSSSPRQASEPSSHLPPGYPSRSQAEASGDADEAYGGDAGGALSPADREAPEPVTDPGFVGRTGEVFDRQEAGTVFDELDDLADAPAEVEHSQEAPRTKNPNRVRRDADWERPRRDDTASRPGTPDAPEDEEPEELWIVVRPDGGEPALTRENGKRVLQLSPPPSGALLAVLDDEVQPVPLEHTHYQVEVAGFACAVDVTQKYQNPFTQKIEAVYTFPLPSDAAVSEFVMQVGQRRIRGIVRERAEAERIYRAARRRGHTAALLTQERPNVFTQKVANIAPGQEIDIELRYHHTLPYRDGSYEVVIPTTVGPRFNPPGSGQTAPQTADVSYRERPGHELSLDMTIDAGVALKRYKSLHHRVDAEELDDGRIRVALQNDTALPNRDFVFRFQVAGQRLETGLMVEHDPDGRGGTYALLLYPPGDARALRQSRRQPLELVFVVDTSGSMDGTPLEQCQDALFAALELLGPEDTFQLISFSDRSSRFARRPLPATRGNLEAAEEWVDDLEAGGGTFMLKGVEAALSARQRDDRVRLVTFMTDGYIGNEARILATVARTKGRSRVFGFGVGSSVNRYLIDGLARLGGGEATYLSHRQSAEPVMQEHLALISRPALGGIEVDFGDANVKDVYPTRLPDLYPGGPPALVVGRFTGSMLTAGEIRASGYTGGRKVHLELGEQLDGRSGDRLRNPGARGPLTAIWARQKIRELSDQLLRAESEAARDELATAGQNTALKYGLVSTWTAFVAVDAQTPEQAGPPARVDVPAAVPEGVNPAASGAR